MLTSNNIHQCCLLYTFQKQHHMDILFCVWLLLLYIIFLVFLVVSVCQNLVKDFAFIFTKKNKLDPIFLSWKDSGMLCWPHKKNQKIFLFYLFSGKVCTRSVSILLTKYLQEFIGEAIQAWGFLCGDVLVNGSSFLNTYLTIQIFWPLLLA